MNKLLKLSIYKVLLFSSTVFSQIIGSTTPWNMYVIDNTTDGADGVKLEDADGDGLLDIVTAFEEGGAVKIFFNPDSANVKNQWPNVKVGSISSPEDAIISDIDGDGMKDVVSFCEGSCKAIYIHWAPSNKLDYKDSTKWLTQVIPASQNKGQWMYGFTLNVDKKYGLDIIGGTKSDNGNAEISWLEAPLNARNINDWKYHEISGAGWVMTVDPVDMDKDGDDDILVTDRFNPLPGVRWLENPGSSSPMLTGAWINHNIYSKVGEITKFLDLGHLNADNLIDAACALEGDSILILEQQNLSDWKPLKIIKPIMSGHPKSTTIADIDLDGKNDIVISSENAKKDTSGIVWISFPNGINSPYIRNEVTGPIGVKYDRTRLIDLDADGDLDILNTEEVEGLGVIWYENPYYNITGIESKTHQINSLIGYMSNCEIKIESLEFKPNKVFILNVEGKIMSQAYKIEQNTNNLHSIEIKFCQLPNGFYLLFVEQAGKYLHKKFVVNN